jgi:hypothetical protein
MPSNVPGDGFQFGKLANNPCSTTLCDLGNGVHANGRQLANLIPSLVLSEYSRGPSNKHTSKSDPWVLKLNGSEPFAVNISSGLPKHMRDGRSRQKILPPSPLPKGYVINQQVENLHSAEIINAGLQAAQRAMNQTSVAAIGELKKIAEAKNDALSELGKKTLNTAKTTDSARILSLIWWEIYFV